MTISEDTLEVLRTGDMGQGERFVVRVVRWNDGPPKLEKRRQWKDTTGDWKNGKCLGLNDEDWQTAILPNVEKIGELLNSK